MTKKFKPTKKIVLKILDIVSHGLIRGKGDPEPGKLCVEAAICLALDLPHSDEPPCVGVAVRAFKIVLNDCHWSSDIARANGMKKLAIAQLGSDTLDQMEFGKRVFLLGTKELLPFVFRKCAEQLPESKQSAMIEWADKLSLVETFEDARRLTKDASVSASASASAYASASASAYASASVSASASASASASVYASAYASVYAPAFGDELLLLTADIGLRVLQEMQSPGCKFLHLVK